MGDNVDSDGSIVDGIFNHNGSYRVYVCFAKCYLLAVRILASPSLHIYILRSVFPLMFPFTRQWQSIVVLPSILGPLLE